MTDVQLNDRVTLHDGRTGQITNLKPGKVCFTRKRDNGVNVTTWMNTDTFLDKVSVNHTQESRKVKERYAYIYSLVRELRGLEIDLSDMRDDGYDEQRPAYRAAVARLIIVKDRLEDFYGDLLGYGHVVDAAQSSRDAYETWYPPIDSLLPTNKIGMPQVHSENWHYTPPWVDFGPKPSVVNQFPERCEVADDGTITVKAVRS